MVTWKEQRRNKNEEFDRLNSKLKSFTERNFKDPDEDKFWEPVVDKAGNGVAIVRWLPAPPMDVERNEEALPVVRWWTHGFQYPALVGQWYIEKSRTTLGEADPCGEMNQKFWNSGDERLKKIVTGDPNVKPKAIAGSKRKENFASGLYIVQHDARPSDNGKCFLFKYGPKIFGKLQEAQNPKSPTKVALNPFDPGDGGANFALVISKNEGGQRSYDSSEFYPPAPLFQNDDDFEAVYAQAYSLMDLIDPKKFKSYDQLKARLEKVMGGSDFVEAVLKGGGKTYTPSVESKPATTKVSSAKPVETYVEPPFDVGGEDDSADLSEFHKLLNKQ